MIPCAARANNEGREVKGLRAQQAVSDRKVFKVCKANKASRVCKAYKELR
jgi:hypothetical protein